MIGLNLMGKPYEYHGQMQCTLQALLRVCIYLDKIATGADDLIEIENCCLYEALRAVETIWYDRQ